MYEFYIILFLVIYSRKNKNKIKFEKYKYELFFYLNGISKINQFKK